MGNCFSNMTEAERQLADQSQGIDELLAQDHLSDSRVIKLLLLGTGDSGKSTIFKQMQVLYSAGFTQAQRETFRMVVRCNVISGLISLVNGVRKLRLELSSPAAQMAAEAVARIPPVSEATVWSDEIGQIVKLLWGSPSSPGDPAIGQAFENRHKFQMDDSSAYFFDNIDRVAAPNYVPIDQDILRARLRTTGITESVFRIDNVNFKFLDVGGQRSERRKWIRCFQDVTAIFFLAAISEIDQVLVEDEKTNRLQESLVVFEDICNKDFFKQTAVILFLNKVDLLEEKIRTRDLRLLFPDFTGGHDFAAACEYIRDQFFLLNHNPARVVYGHFTCATDTNNVRRVFEDCRKIILKQNLERNGLVSGPM